MSIVYVSNRQSELEKLAADVGLCPLTEPQLMAMSGPAPVVICGVYFLMHSGTVVYVGQSTHVWARACEHLRSFDFERVAIIPCERSQLDLLESLYIHHYCPVHNGHRQDQKHAPLRLSAVHTQLRALQSGGA